jgi:hypothetical protein
MTGGNDGGAPAWASEQRLLAAQWHRDRGAALDRLWTYFYGIGGDADQFTVDAYLHEIGSLPPSQISLLALAMNEIDHESPSGSRD